MATLRDVQANRTDYAKGKTDAKVSSAHTTAENMRKATPLLKELVSITTKYHGLLCALSTTGTQMEGVLEQLSKCYEGDSAAAVAKVASTHKQLDQGRGKIAEELMSKVIVPIGAHFPEEHKEVERWIRDSKKKRGQSLTIIQKHEEKAKKLQKKAQRNPQLLEPILANLEEAITSHDRLLGESLKEIRLMERKRLCSFIEGWVDVIEVESNVLGITWDDLNNCKDPLRSFARDNNNIGDADTVINSSRPNSSLEHLKEARRTGYYDSNQMAYLQDSLRTSSLNLHDMADGVTGYDGGSSSSGRSSPHTISRGTPPPPGRGGPPPPPGSYPSPGGRGPPGGGGESSYEDY